MTQEGFTEGGGHDQKGKRAAPAGFTEQQATKHINFLMDNELLYNICLMDDKEPK